MKTASLLDKLVSDSGILFIAALMGIVILVVILLKYLGRSLAETKEPISGSFNDALKRLLVEISQTGTVIIYLGIAFFAFYFTFQFIKGTTLEFHAIEWINLFVRWAHVTAGILWIGASFYFVFLENSLNRTEGLRKGIAGDLWAIHGGGFYYVEKYQVAPEELPKKLHWFKYEAYFTWLTGFALLWIVYYMNAGVYLIDPNVLDISPKVGVVIGIFTLLASWLIYDVLCRTPLIKRQLLFAAVSFLFFAGFAYFLNHVFSSRAAFMHVGALLGTLMAGNVFRVIIPSQKAMVKAAEQGEPVDPALGQHAGLRSLHNNYMTLPVIFIMISGHFPSTYGSEFNWAVLAGLALASAGVKHYWNLREKGQKSAWILPVSVLALIALAVVTAPPSNRADCSKLGEVSYIEVYNVIKDRCVSCHSASPTDEINTAAPNGIMFDTPDQIVKYADRIMNRAVITKTMPQANRTGMSQEERDLLQCWIEQGARIDQ